MTTGRRTRTSNGRKSFLRILTFYLFALSFCFTVLVLHPSMPQGVPLSPPLAAAPDSPIPPAESAAVADSMPIPTANVQVTQWARMTTAVALREEPKLTSPEIVEASPGDLFPVQRHENRWFEVKLGDSRTGWFQDDNASVEERTENKQILAVRTDAPLYTGPGISFDQAQAVRKNSSYIPGQVSGQWIELQGEGNGTRWIEAGSVIWTCGEPAAAAAFGEIGDGNGDFMAGGIGPLAGKTIVVDPGHGGIDTGARGKIAEVNERDVNLSVAVALQHKLQAAGALVLMTRTTNDVTVSLQSRVDLSNRNKADLFVSIHQNMFAQDPSVSGTITFYSGRHSEEPAKAIEQGALASLGSKEEKMHIEEDQLFVLRNNRQPAVLVEGCFLSNPEELANSLTTGYQEKLAEGIYEGIRDYMLKP